MAMMLPCLGANVSVFTLMLQWPDSSVPVFTLNAAMSSFHCVGGHMHQCCHILGLWVYGTLLKDVIWLITVFLWDPIACGIHVWMQMNFIHFMSATTYPAWCYISLGDPWLSFQKTKQYFARSSISSYTSTDSLCQFNPFSQRTSNNSLVTCYLNENKLQTLQCQPHLIWMQMKFKHVNVSHILSECKWTSNTSCQPHLIWMKMYFKNVDVSHILSNFKWTSNISKVFMSATFMSPNSNCVIIIYTVHWKINVTPILWLLIDWAHCVLLM